MNDILNDTEIKICNVNSHWYYLEQDIIDLCYNFSQECDITKYVERGGNPERIRTNLYQGKMAEYIAAQYAYEELLLPYITPDTKIYEADKKSFSPDLPFTVTFPWHIKSCDQYNLKVCKGKESYTFELKDTKSRPRDSTDIICCILMDETVPKFRVRFLIRWDLAISKLDLMVSPKLKSKRALYYKDIAHLL